jgi:hypothetical protein
MRRLLCSLGLAALAVTFVPAPAHAQQAFNFYIGGFSPRGLDSRDPNDVLLQDTAFLDFDFHRFDRLTVGGEWLVNLGDKTEAGLGVGFYQHTAHALDCCSVNDQTGLPIAADLKLRTVPFAATLRYLPMGHGNSVEPYVGAGLTAIAWRYSEIGDFVSTDGVTIVSGRYVGSGGAVGPVILGGVRFPFGPASIGGEIRYQNAKADLPSDQGFAGSKIDLGGFNYLVTFNLKF